MIPSRRSVIVGAAAAIGAALVPPFGGTEPPWSSLPAAIELDPINDPPFIKHVKAHQAANLWYAANCAPLEVVDPEGFQVAEARYIEFWEAAEALAPRFDLGRVCMPIGESRHIHVRASFHDEHGAAVQFNDPDGAALTAAQLKRLREWLDEIGFPET